MHFEIKAFLGGTQKYLAHRSKGNLATPLDDVNFDPQCFSGGATEGGEWTVGSDSSMLGFNNVLFQQKFKQKYALYWFIFWKKK